MTTANNILCTCGHRYDVHGATPLELWDKDDLNCCWGSHETDKGLFCPCEEFVQDNLKYLEQKYDNKRTQF